VRVRGQKLFLAQLLIRIALADTSSMLKTQKLRSITVESTVAVESAIGKTKGIDNVGTKIFPKDEKHCVNVDEKPS
jgi:hypothetical protein